MRSRWTAPQPIVCLDAGRRLVHPPHSLTPFFSTNICGPRLSQHTLGVLMDIFTVDSPMLGLRR